MRGLAITMLTSLVMSILVSSAFPISLDLSRNSSKWMLDDLREKEVSINNQLSRYGRTVDRISFLKTAIDNLERTLGAVKLLESRRIQVWTHRTFEDLLHYLESIAYSYEYRGVHLKSLKVNKDGKVTMVLLPGLSEGLKGEQISVRLETAEDKFRGLPYRKEPPKTLNKQVTITVRLMEKKPEIIIEKKPEIIGASQAPLEYLGVVDGRKQWRILPSEGIGR